MTKEELTKAKDDMACVYVIDTYGYFENISIIKGIVRDVYDNEIVAIENSVDKKYYHIRFGNIFVSFVDAYEYLKESFYNILDKLEAQEWLEEQEL